jgi:hypothetical protein
VRRLTPLTIAILAVLAVGCGGDETATPAPAPVRLTVTAPGDLAVVQDERVAVRGTVSPAGAAVLVRGQAAEVVGGRFTAQVSLDPGTNVIDVAATATDRAPALTAFRVTREMPVEVPDLSGMTAEQARAAVAAVGLKLREEEAGGILEKLLPGDRRVCRQEPEEGTEARRGTSVGVLLGKGC